MMFKIDSSSVEILTDTMTPVNMYLKIRNYFSESILLESSDYGANDNSVAYICFNPIASFSLKDDNIHLKFPDGSNDDIEINESISVVSELEKFVGRFKVLSKKNRFLSQGIFGYTSYEAVKYFEDIELKKYDSDSKIPEIYYAFYKNVITINVFNNQATIFCHNYQSENNLNDIINILNKPVNQSFPFSRLNKAKSNLSDEEYLELVKKGIKHCKRGDVFQIVLSRRFSQEFKGDDFTLYRILRSINPSPYIFYFDFGNFKIFGSSPEAQIVVKNNIAEIHPIAGTFIRTGNDSEDKKKAIELSKDLKENAEHMMLVDLARNDLSRNGYNVKVKKDREVQFYSHVIHLVSKVVGQIKKSTSTLQIVADTFPAGTLSGAPKHKAMELINKYENSERSFYGGSIGFMDFDGNFNHAIIIRSFLSKNNFLHFQAGAGVVSKSKPESELQEVYNKLKALNKAMENAEKYYE